MIIELIVKALSTVLKAVIGLFPNGPAPAWLDDGSGYLATVFAAGAGLGAWIPWALVGQVVTAVCAAVVIGFGIKVVRIVASFFTAGGGSAA